MSKESIRFRMNNWNYLFEKHAADLYPGRYTSDFVRELAEQAEEIHSLQIRKKSLVVAHSYLYPEFHEIADFVGDSLGLALHVRAAQAPRVDFSAVFFMGETAKIILGDKTRVYMQGDDKKLGCSLVFGSDLDWIGRWKKQNPGGVLVTYVNSSAELKAMSDYIGTSRNTDRIIARAWQDNPGQRILVLPDKFLGYVMKARAVKEHGVPADMIDIYDHEHNGCKASCYVHELIGMDGLDNALDENPDAELLIHPECGCAAQCLLKIQRGEIPHGRAFYYSTEGMLEHARKSDKKRFIVATEKGMIYRLRKMLPEKEFIPVSYDAECRYMKGNTLAGLLETLKTDRYEIVINESGIGSSEGGMPKTFAMKRSVADAARLSVERMMSIT